jgi:multidrug efflux pump subunit AcrA (membrane-fusion protein)
VVDDLSFTGRVAPVQEANLYFKTDGRVKRIYVDRNDMVEAGTLIAELENDDLVRQLGQTQIELETAQLNLAKSQNNQQFVIEKARIDLEVARTQLEKLRESLAAADLDIRIAQVNLDSAAKGPSAEDVAIARSQLERAKSSLWSAQVNRDSACGRGPGAACDSAQAGVQSAEQSVRIEELSLQKLLKGADQRVIMQLQAAVAKAQQNHRGVAMDIAIQEQRVALAEMDMQRLTDEIDPQLTKAVDRAILTVERLQAQVNLTQISSPIAGKVTSVGAYEGRTVQAYKAVFVVADEKDLVVTAEPMSTQLQRLTEGMDCVLALSAYPGKELPGSIVQLPYPYGGGGGATLDEADKRTHITFDPQDIKLEPGDLVKVIVTLERKEDALWLPPAAIRTFAGRKFVVVQDEGSQRRVDVTVGIESLERVEILDGLQEGQIVIGQ